jgi:AraC-like DNA-binding protein
MTPTRPQGARARDAIVKTEDSLNLNTFLRMVSRMRWSVRGLERTLDALSALVPDDLSHLETRAAAAALANRLLALHAGVGTGAPDARRVVAIGKLCGSMTSRMLRRSITQCRVAPWPPAASHGSVGQPSPADARVVSALHYIHEHFWDSAISLSKVSESVRLSPWHFDRLLKRETGFSYHVHLRRVRMEAASKLVKNSHLTIKEVAGLAGYSQGAQFSREFKGCFGVTPTQWRRCLDGDGATSQGAQVSQFQSGITDDKRHEGS